MRGAGVRLDKRYHRPADQKLSEITPAISVGRLRKISLENLRAPQIIALIIR
jgi:hypothetical protein